MADPTETPTVPTGEGVNLNPEWAGDREIPEKFRAATPQDAFDKVLESYTALEKKQGQAPTPPKPGDSTPPVATPPVTPAAGLNVEKPAVAETIVDLLGQVGLKAEDLKEQWSKDGTLTDEQYAAFRTKGYGKEAVDGFISNSSHDAAAAQVNVTASMAAASSAAGGDDKLQALLGWVQTGLTADELAVYNEMVADANITPARAEMAIQWALAKHRTSVGAGNAHPLVEGGPTPVTGGAQGFKTIDEQNRAMNDTRYSPTNGGMANPDFDQAFHDQVNARLMKTNF